jgi:Na+/proline symporter
MTSVLSTLDWVVMLCTLASIVGFGLWKSRGTKTVGEYLLANRTMPWYAMGLSIMATQAGAVTFISTTGQAYVDGMRFVQFYFGLPIAMVILCIAVVPVFHRTRVFTAYEYLEQRFDAKTRALASIIFLIQRGLGAGITIYAPAIALSVIFSWDDRVTVVVIGLTVIFYTATGGIPAVTWTDVVQMSVIFCGLILALVMVFRLLPAGVSPLDAVYLAGSAGRLNAVDTHFDWNNRYNLWSGLIGGAFLALAYFGCDQSQVQRYLTGKSIEQSKLSLLFNAMAKVPMQFFILFVGAMVFVVYQFIAPPMLFQPHAMEVLRGTPGFAAVSSDYDHAFASRKNAAYAILDARHKGNGAALEREKANYAEAQGHLLAARGQGVELYEKAANLHGFNDANYVFLTFVTHYLPVGVIGLIIAVIFSAAMSASSGEVNSLATVTVIDIYKRHIKPVATDGHYLLVSRQATVFWGAYAMLFAQYARTLGSLVEAVNMIGSLFYGTLLGVFTLAFFFKRVRGTGAFWGMLLGEAAILAVARFTKVTFLWYNVIGAVVVVIAGLVINQFEGAREHS